MRIAFLNVWANKSAEAHIGEALRGVARGLGHELKPCVNSAEVEAFNPDFAIVLSRTQARLTRCPTYLAINEPASVYLREPGLFLSVLTFDGYLALADSLRGFLKNALHGIGRKEEVGEYYNTSARFDGGSEPVRKALLEGKGRLTYFGTNWDGRRISFFKSLGQWEDVELYGRKEAWEQHKIPNYKGEVTFDGFSLHEIYRRNGIGLNIQGDHHVYEDVISNRVFEITAVGAVCLSARMPWLEKNYGDSLYYFEQEQSDLRLLENIRALLDHIHAHPEEAWEKAQKARRIFEEKFALDVLLEKTVSFHVKRREAFASRDRGRDPLISVIICSDGGNIKGLQKACGAIAAQDAGRFELVLVKTAPFSFTPPASPFLVFKEVAAEEGKTPLWQGLAATGGDHVAMLDEACEWFPQHVRRLLDTRLGDGDFAHSAVVEQCLSPPGETAWVGNNELRRLTCHLDVKGREIRNAAELIHPCGFLAPRRLLDEDLMDDPGLGKGAARYLVLSLLARARPVQNFAPTVLTSTAVLAALQPSNEEWTAIMLRLWRATSRNGGANTFLDQFPDAGFRMRARRYETRREEKDGVVHDRLSHSRFDPARLKPAPLPWVRAQSFFHLGLSLIDAAALSLSIKTSETMRGLAGFIAFPLAEDGGTPVEYLVVVEAEVERGQFSVQLLHNERTLERYAVARTFTPGKRYVLEIPVYFRPEVSGIVIDVSPNTTAHIRRISARVEE